MIELIAVNSSAIRAIGWAGGVLRVVFVSGRAYDFPGVPFSVYVAFMNATSKGGFYNTFIRGRY